MAPSGNPGISNFGAQVKGGTAAQSCTIADVSADPLQCTIGGLRGGHEYTVEVKSCLPESIGCSATKEKNVATKTPRKFPYTSEGRLSNDYFYLCFFHNL